MDRRSGAGPGIEELWGLRRDGQSADNGGGVVDVNEIACLLTGPAEYDRALPGKKALPEVLQKQLALGRPINRKKSYDNDLQWAPPRKVLTYRFCS
jgi:hypothetical protein